VPGWLKAVIALPLICISCGVGDFFFIRSQTPYDDAVDKAINDPRVQAALGTPISAATFFGGKGNVHGVFAGEGKSTLQVVLTGSRQEGVLLGAAVKTSGVWGFSKLEVHTQEGKTIDLAYHSR
jgi:hypothetical protein